jgi:hypothetical protein
MRHALLAALAVIAAACVLCSPAQAQSVSCQQSAFATIGSATDTQLVAAPPAGQSIYVCDYEISTSAADNLYLETATSGTCGGSKTQIAGTYYGGADTIKPSGNPYWRGISTGALQLCVNSSTSGPASITVFYSIR